MVENFGKTANPVGLHGNLLKVPKCKVFDRSEICQTGLLWCYVMHIPQRCLAAEAAEAALLCWLLSSAAREMHTCTLAGYVITR